MGIETQERIHFLDSLRGSTLIHMILFHLCYDLVFFFNLDLPWYTGLFGHLWGSCIRWSFILISGMVFSKGHHPFRRGIVLMGWGCVLTLVTWFVTPDALIRFGILSFLGAASLIGAVVYPYMEKVPAFFGFLCCTVLLAVTWPICKGGIGLGNEVLWKLPDAFYRTRWLYWMGFPNEAFHSADYFSVLPWIFLFFMGIYLAKIFCGRGVMQGRIGRWKPGVMAFCGRRSLYIYLIHQPIIYIFCLIIGKVLYSP